MQVCSHHGTPGDSHARPFSKVQGSPRAGCTGAVGPEPGRFPGRLYPLECRGATQWPCPQPSSGAAALLQGKKQWADFRRPGHTIPVPEPSHLHPTRHPSMPFQPHGHHSVVATITSFLVMTSASTIHALGPVSHTPARASCPEEKLHSIPPVLPSCHDPSADSPALPLSTGASS